MKHARQYYYDAFSSFYDPFVALHSRDRKGLARTFLANQLHVNYGDSVLDLCTGTGTLLSVLSPKVGDAGHVVGLDFSSGMLRVASEKVRGLCNVSLVQADAGRLPFDEGDFDAVTCSYAFYELKGETQQRVLMEICRVLKPDGTFFMMEHEVPRNPLVKSLFYVRLSFVGSGRAVAFLRDEQQVLQSHFRSVEKVVAPNGRSKVMICRK